MQCWCQNVNIEHRSLWEWYNQGIWVLIHFCLVHRLVGRTWLILNFVLCTKSVFRRNAADWHYEAAKSGPETLLFPKLAAWVMAFRNLIDNIMKVTWPWKWPWESVLILKAQCWIIVSRIVTHHSDNLWWLKADNGCSQHMWKASNSWNCNCQKNMWEYASLH